MFFPATFKNWCPLIWRFLDKTTSLMKISKITFFDLVYFLIFFKFSVFSWCFFQVFLEGSYFTQLFEIIRNLGIFLLLVVFCFLFFWVLFLYVFSRYDFFSSCFVVVFLLKVFCALCFFGVLFSKKKPLNTTRPATSKVCSIFGQHIQKVCSIYHKIVCSKLGACAAN